MLVHLFSFTNAENMKNEHFDFSRVLIVSIANDLGATGHQTIPVYILMTL